MIRLTNEELALLKDKAYEIRKLSLEMITYGQWGHIGGAFSMAEILSVLYWKEMKIDPEKPLAEERDRLILSKAHGSPALYAALAARGYMPIERIYQYCELKGLEGHTHIHSAPGIEASGGPLGMGLSVCVGMAMGLRKKENPRSRVYCLLGDGECNEGNVWEAAMSAKHYHLDNLIAIVDYNKAMAKGFIWDLMSIEPFADKWKAFGWNVQEIDGHDIEAIANALYTARWIKANGAPNVIIAHTVKGKGIERAEFNYKWHTHAPDPKTADEMMREVSKKYGYPEEGYSKINEEVKKETFYGGE
jgi:transketolase